MPFIVLLDASVLVPAALCDTLLRAAEADLYQVRWSPDILREVSRGLTEGLKKSPKQAKRRIAAMRRAFKEAEVRSYQRLVPAMMVHRNDRHVAAAAIAGRAQVIVTNNLRHFPRRALKPYDIEVQPPDEFLNHLFSLDPDLMIEVLQQQAAALGNPPATPQDICERLYVYAPTFAGRVLERLK